MASLNPASEPRKIRDLNDDFRTTFVGGAVVCTPGFLAVADAQRAALLEAVRNYDAFTSDNDPYEEHDFGSISMAGYTVFFKIDYFDRSVRIHSPDPADPVVTTRILTIMLASEY